MKNFFSKLLLSAVGAAALFSCSQEEIVEKPLEDVAISAASTSTACSSCDYVVPSSGYTQVIDGKKLGLGPGDVICLSASNSYKNITFRNIVGSSSDPIIIQNCGGTATVNATGMPYNIKTEYSKYFKITGGSGSTYGIRLNGGHMGMTMEKLSTNFEINNIEVYNSGFAGIMAKTDPTCDDATIRGNFVMRDVSVHDNYVHDVGGEGLYIGNSFYEKGRSLSCGTRYPHIIDGLKIYNNRVIRPGWEGIQVGCAINGAYVYNNVVEDYGMKNEPVQNNGIQFSEGTKGILYNNMINRGKGIGINIVGYGDSFVHNNIIVEAGSFGIFCDERTTRNLPGFRIINNTIVSPKQDGMRMYNDYVPGKIYNNIVVNPGNYSIYVYPRTGEDAYVYKLGRSIPVEMSNNIFTRDINYLKFANASADNFKIAGTSPAVNKGKDIRTFNITKDFFQSTRLAGIAYDIGACEYGGTQVIEDVVDDVADVVDGSDDGTNTAPRAYSGTDRVISTNNTIINGSASDSDGTVVSYSWTKRSGGAVTMTNTNSDDLHVSNLVDGTYVFVLTVKDNDGATHSDAMMLTVKGSKTTTTSTSTSTSNIAPVAYSGQDQVIYKNSTMVYGSATDKDGTIASYTWTKRSGGAVSMSGTNTKTLSLSGMVKGSYVFVLTVKDNDGATHSDAMMVTYK